MPRTPKPSTTKTVFVRLEMPNLEYLTGQAVREGAPYGTIFNREIEFVRTAGLPPSLVRSVEERARAANSSLRREFEKVILFAARDLPPEKWTPLKGTASAPKYHESTINISEPNREYLEKLLAERGDSMTAVMNDELRFARHFGLSLDLEARLHAHLRRTNTGLREWALIQMFRHALALQAGDPHEAITDPTRFKRRT